MSDVFVGRDRNGLPGFEIRPYRRFQDRCREVGRYWLMSAKRRQFRGVKTWRFGSSVACVPLFYSLFILQVRETAVQACFREYKRVLIRGGGLAESIL